MSRHLSSLRFQLIAIVLLSVLPAMVLILYSGFEERRHAAPQAQASAKKIVELASEQQARIIGEGSQPALHPVTETTWLPHRGLRCKFTLGKIQTLGLPFTR